MDIIIAIYLYSNFRGYFGSQGWWLCFIIVPSIYLLTEMVCICMLMAYLLLWLRSKYRSLDLCQGVRLCRYNNEQTTKQTKAINNSYISCKCDTNRAGHFTLDAHASRPVACLTHWGRDNIDAVSQTTFSSAFSWMKIFKMFEFRLKFHCSLFLRVKLTKFQHWFR